MEAPSRVCYEKFIITTSWIIASSLLLSSSTYAISSTAQNISIGMHKEELESPIFYSTFIPILYEYNVPRYTALDITLRDWREKCKTESFSPSYTCPVFFHYEKYLERFESEVVPKPWSVNTQDANKPNVPSVPKTSSDFCNAIQQHFPGAITQQFGFEEYIEKLQKCPLGDILITRGINDYVFNIKQLFKNMNKNYENEFSNTFIGANTKLTPAFYVNAVTAHQNGMLLAYLLEKNRWSEAELSCNSKQIPKSLVRMDNFTSSLGKLGQLLNNHKVISSISIGEASSFYKLPITDCSYVENAGTFVVRIQIPVINKGLSPSLYRLKPIPFIFKDAKDETGNNLQLCQIQTDSSTVYLFDKVSGILQTSKCNPSSPICKLDSFVSSNVMDPCISSIFSESLEGVRKNCEMKCTDFKEDGLKMLPAFHQTRPDTFLVTGHLLTGISIRCQGKQDKTLQHPEIGALEVKLPCSCYLAYHTYNYYPDSSCQDDIEPQITHILPVNFIRNDKLKQVKSSLFSNSSENSIDFTSDYVIPSMTGKSLEGFGAHTSAHISEAGSGGGDGGNTFLWVVFLLQLIVIIAFTAHYTYKYIDRRRKLNAFSKERLVYHPYPSTSNQQNINSPSASSSTDSYPYPTPSQRSSVTENNLNVL